ncbi:Sigma 54 modulation protein / S30EA ribosomal protein [Pseudomonas sp. 22 E 5]|jgi:ribosome-associated translation inhibitor RaiA|uniref:HPF/RaiA family ribosome-associated protein n=1 Tax=Pseudomonas canadensis TaxID=915099 RepID=A0ABZ1A8Z4_9PSED|nr:HPF/RaiA family ribosome-associated protein [Pseudomonas canadensis]CRM96075.1 Sigma 54 modulation protein / S30EA ribosomal protein [Pseudomonas sp. 22 E 5]MCF5171175.1 ribosomal subunit interface protein [Pseudomonas canadensis]WLH31101.1 HPF/RaiA family ribosome-associated protein [Pseudomonas canadensis]WNJ86389.1 HPF/RaiA family ribosome-associated protein [Pseudomonas canadensis]WRI25869.1 HPF/RaiA family ribosome-associated protein [Pseudomonas canadensis]
MQIQVNSDNHIESSIRLEEWVRTTIESTLERYEEDLTRVEVYLRDENGDKPGPHDLSCRLEARPKGHQPVSVLHKADTLEQAIDGAATKLDHALEHLFGRLQGKPRAAGKSQPTTKVNEDELEQEFLEKERAVFNG